jgi:CRP-like cAMP-binding protein
MSDTESVHADVASFAIELTTRQINQEKRLQLHYLDSRLQVAYSSRSAEVKDLILSELQKHAFFADLPHHELEEVSKYPRVVNLEEGDVLYRCGDSAEACYVVLFGSIAEYTHGSLPEKPVEVVQEIAPVESSKKLGNVKTNVRMSRLSRLVENSKYQEPGEAENKPPGPAYQAEAAPLVVYGTGQLCGHLESLAYARTRVHSARCESPGTVLLRIPYVHFQNSLQHYVESHLAPALRVLRGFDMHTCTHEYMNTMMYT